MKCTLREWQNNFKDISTLIVQASAKDGSDSWQPFPIGMSWQFALHSHLNSELQIGNHEQLVLCCFKASTDETRRPSGINRRAIEYLLRQNGIENIPLDHPTYFRALPHFKFIISPEGNGIDCHRHYEALLAGAIPIIEKNTLVEEKYQGCPILYTTDYSEITPDYLEKKYTEMLDNVYDFSKLFLSYYDDETQKNIKECGNHWLSQVPDTSHIVWYS